MLDLPLTVLTHRVFPETLAILAGRTEVLANNTEATLASNEILDRCRAADAIMAFMPDSIDDEFLAACPNLKIVACALKGYDNFDVAACTRRNVWLTVVDDLLTMPTAELAIGLMISLSRHVLAGDADVRGNRFFAWRPTLYGTGLAGRTVGIVGMGKVGQAIAKRLDGFDAELLYTDKAPLDPVTTASLHLTHTGFEALMSRSDFVVLATSLTAETRHLVDTRSLGMMKPGAFLVNPARGSLVDEEAVANALADGRLGGYAADVFAFEDWADVDRPKTISQQLLEDTDRTLFTPHLGSAVVEVRKAIEAEAAASIIEALRGERPAGAVNELFLKRSVGTQF
ncbi:MAG: Phosphonate dehydrogenase [Alphaproteobacteria bacterium MarineAlpha4_Bin2]|nr:MAG: Phosphonate dehydrogenase [Alphaproteobacteria bacterium MarineAlpha4_Bin2]